jgi:hypothetical protein
LDNYSQYKVIIYYLGEQTYTALRIRDAKRVAKEHQLDESLLLRDEQHALTALRAYDRGTGSLEDAYQAILAYATHTGHLTERMQADYRRTLAARPWKTCPCAICQQIGVEVIIFRGNNRNRRRGFHNTWHLYQQLQAIAGDQTNISQPSTLMQQHPLAMEGDSQDHK